MNTDVADKVLILELGATIFALPLAVVERVIRAVAITPLPNAPAALLGGINVHNRAIPVLNTYHYFNAPAREVKPADFLVLLEIMHRRMALLAHRVIGVVALSSLGQKTLHLKDEFPTTGRDGALDQLMAPLGAPQNSSGGSADVRIYNGQLVVMADPASFLHIIPENTPALDL